MRVCRTSSIISGSLMPCPTQRKGRSKKNWTSCSDKNENSRIKFRFWSSYFQCVMKPTPAFVRVNATLRFVRLNAMVGLHLLLQTNLLVFLRKNR